MTSFVPSSSGIITIPVLNVNFLYLQGVPVGDLSGQLLYIQGEINTLDSQVSSLTAIVNRIDLTGLTGNLIITDANKNSVLLTAIQALQGQVGNINQFDLTALAPYPPAHITITPTTTNQALDGKITTNTTDISTLNGNVTTINGQIGTINGQIGTLNTNVALLNGDVTTINGQITTISGQITTLQNQVTSINNSITAINAKLANFTVWTVGSSTMNGFRNNTGFAVDLGGNDTGNGLFVYPNSDAHNAQVRIETSNDKQLYMRGGGAVTLYAGSNGSITNRNAVFIGDETDNIKIGSFSGAINFPLVEIGTSGAGFVSSTTRLKGDVYLTSNPTVSIYDQLVTASGNGLTVGKLNNTTSPFLSGLTVTTVVGFPLISITQLFGAITLTTGAGLISLITGVGGINMTCGGGAVTINTGGGALSLACGAGVLNMASGTGTSNWTTANGDLYLGAGKGSGGVAGNVNIASLQNIILNPDLSCNIYKTEFMEMNSLTASPATTTRRIYDISGALYYNGTILSNTPDPSGIYVLKAGSTMTGTLVAPQITTPLITTASGVNLLIDPSGGTASYNKSSYMEFVDTPPAVTTNRLYQQSNQLYFDGTALGGGGVGFLPLTGGTLTGALISNYDAGQSVPQLQITNTNNSAPVSSQGATLAIRNDATGAGSVGEKCGQITFLAKDSVGTGARNYSSIQSYINDPTSFSIDGRMGMYVANNNTSTELMRLQSVALGNVKRCDIGSTYMEIGTTAIGSTSTSTLTVNGTANINTSLQTPLIYNALNIYPATSTTLVDNAVRKYQPERLYKLLTYPEPLSAPTIDGEKIYIVNPTGVPTSSMDSFVKKTDFGNQGSATWLYIQKCCFYYGSSVAGGVDAYYFACKYSDNYSYVFAYIDIDGTAWKLYPVGRADGEINDMCVGNPAFGGGGTNHRVYVGGSFVNMMNSASPQTLVQVNNIGIFNVTTTLAGGLVSTAVSQMLSARDPAIAHESDFTDVAGVAGAVNCCYNASGLSSAFVVATAQDIIVIGGQFYSLGAVGGATPYRNLASIAWYNPTYTSGLQVAQIGFSTLNNNSVSGNVVTGVGTDQIGERVIGVGFFNSGYGVMVYTGTTFNNETGASTNSNYMVYFYVFQGTVTFQIPSSDDQFLETGQTFPNEGSYNYTNVIKGGKGASPAGTNGDFTFHTLCVTNGLLPTGASNWGVNYRPTSIDPYEYSACLVIDDLVVFPSRQPQIQFGSKNICGFYCNQLVYPDEYFLGVFTGANVYQSYTISAPFTNPNYAYMIYNGVVSVVRGFASYSTLLGYTGLNCWGMASADNTCDWFYKTTAIGDLVIELSGCLVRTAPNIYAKDTITFLGNNDGSSLCLIGDTNTTTNPFGKASWWAFSQDGAVKYDSVTVDSGGINSIIAGTGISEVTNAGSVTITNTGVTQIIAGSNITITSTGTSGTGDVTINATGGVNNGYCYWFWNVNTVTIPFIYNASDGNYSYVAFAGLLAPTYTSGIGSHFSVSTTGANAGRIKWNGTNPVTLSCYLTVNVTIQELQGGIWNTINISQLPNNLDAQVGFGISLIVYDNAGQPAPQSQGANTIFMNRTNSGSNGLNNGYLIGSLAFNTQMRNNDEIEWGFSANSWWNTGTAGQYRAYLEGAYGSINGGLGITVTEMPLP